jgi:hypothetical protein
MGNSWVLNSTAGGIHTVTIWFYVLMLKTQDRDIADKLARDGSAQRFVGPEPFLGVSRQNVWRKMKRWIENKHLALWRSPWSTQRQARALIWLQGLDYCPLTGHKPGLLLACLLDITPWGDIYISQSYVMTPCAGNVVLRRKPQFTFCVSVRL